MEIMTRAAAKARGLKRYFTGKPCKRGHITERYVVDYSCVDCHREWDKSHPEEKRRWAQANKEKVQETGLAANRRYREKHQEESREYQKLWKRRWRQNNPEEARAIGSEFQRRRRKNNPDKVRAKERATKHRRHAQRLLSPSTFTETEWDLLVARSPRCHWCKRPFNRIRRPTHDHVVPLSKRGPDTLENSCCSCGSCNSGKRDRLVNPSTGQGILL